MPLAGYTAIDATVKPSVGQALQNWLIRNKMNIYHPLFVDAVDKCL